MNLPHRSLRESQTTTPDAGVVVHGRREWKYLLPLCTGLHYDNAILRLCPALRPAYPPRYICNVYFDTPALQCYADNLGGFPERVKVRIRWYGELLASDDCTLELKKRRNQFTWKTSCALGDLELQTWSWDEVRQFLIEKSAPSFHRYIDTICIPTLITRYRRQYYEAIDSNIRVTIDSDLVFVDQRNRSAPNFTFNPYRFNSPLLELKFPLAARTHALGIVKSLNLRRTRFSKYSVGMECVSSRSQRRYI